MAKRVVQVAKAAREKKKRALEVIAELCLTYPQYKFHEARKLPYKRVAIMLRVAHREKALQYHTLTQIAYAPHTQKAKAVEVLLKHFKDKASG